jgi:serine/threonine protein kinase
MEFLEGGELGQHLKQKGRFSEDEAKAFFKQILSAMAYCHQNRVIHRDLKLENLLLVKKNSDQIKVNYKINQFR